MGNSIFVERTCRLPRIRPRSFSPTASRHLGPLVSVPTWATAFDLLPTLLQIVILSLAERLHPSTLVCMKLRHFLKKRICKRNTIHLSCSVNPTVEPTSPRFRAVKAVRLNVCGLIGSHVHHLPRPNLLLILIHCPGTEYVSFRYEASGTSDGSVVVEVQSVRVVFLDRSSLG